MQTSTILSVGGVNALLPSSAALTIIAQFENAVFVDRNGEGTGEILEIEQDTYYMPAVKLIDGIRVISLEQQALQEPSEGINA